MTEQAANAGLGLAPGSRPLTVADLETMPDDGRRYELIDGILLVSPAPQWRHQAMLAGLFRVLDPLCPPDLRIVMAPFAVRTSESNEVQPDLIVARFADLTPAALPVAPVLAVEVLSPSTQLYDRNLKLAHYARIGVASYWLLDPADEGSIAVHSLEDGTLREVATASGEQPLTLRVPFDVTLVAARLLDDLRPRP
ncbi:MAG: Uma2 family endonuclease [Sporichthyaceae bacterium]